jgi:hypothetical protein
MTTTLSVIKVSNYPEKSVFSEKYNLSANQEISLVLWNLKTHYPFIRNNLPLDSILFHSSF